MVMFWLAAAAIVGISQQATTLAPSDESACTQAPPSECSAAPTPTDERTVPAVLDCSDPQTNHLVRDMIGSCDMPRTRVALSTRDDHCTALDCSDDSLPLTSAPSPLPDDNSVVTSGLSISTPEGRPLT